LAHCIGGSIDALALSALFHRSEGGGSRNQPIHPALQVKAPPGLGDAPNTPARKKPGRASKRVFGEPKPKAQDHFTNPGSRIMKTSPGFEQRFNAQTGDDNPIKAHAQMVVAAELNNCGANSAALLRMQAVAQHKTGGEPEVSLADAGERGESGPYKPSRSPPEVIVALGRQDKKQIAIDVDRMPHTAATVTRPQSEQGHAKHRRRQATAKSPNGWIKQMLEFWQFSKPRLDQARREFKLICDSMNPRRMATMTMQLLCAGGNTKPSKIRLDREVGLEIHALAG
jgi:hypothetical protein